MLSARSYVLFSSIILLLFSCKGPREVIYFVNDTKPDSNVLYQDITQRYDAIIQPNDIIAINVSSISFVADDRPSLVFLEGGLAYSASPTMGAGTKNSFLVDSSGFIDYPRIGRLKMAGLSIPQAKQELASRLKDYLKQPVIEVRIVNFRITMLGAVGTPGPLLTSNHKLSIVDALAAAGGIPPTGRKDNVLIIREEKGRREFARIDLNSRNVFNSPYYYLHQNDIVYVEPSRISKQESNEFLRFYLPTITSFLGIALTVFALIRISNNQ